ncbi:MAG: DegV family protein [Bacteroidales bacterium]|nr:DegV family protein [Bacteroidales bacterium]
MLTLFTDTDCDMTPALAKEFGYKFIPMPYAVDGKLITPYVDWDTFDSRSFYNMLRAGTIPTTSAISEAVYLQHFEPEFAAGNDILYVHFSSGLSNTFENMDKAIATLKAKYPERTLYTVDTLGISALCLNICMEISDLYKAGKTAEEIVEWAKVEVPKFPMYFFADDLKFFRRSGRVSGLAATMGNFIGIRPIIYLDNNGKMISIGKETGRAKTIDRLLTYVDELGEDVSAHRVIIGHSDCQELVDIVIAKLRAKYGDGLRIITTVVNPTIGSHCGPNGLGICFHAKHR